ncbi:uncharacterized protein LOC135219296 [Macrobrachium nipponense]|uniref:uncharacterized protein LOC135219296 n=1 Tax=Macrobrachium nipponense TaxID=159736 RepID=UPI0030C7A443
MLRLTSTLSFLRKCSVDQWRVNFTIRCLACVTLGSGIVIFLSTFFDLIASKNQVKVTSFDHLNCFASVDLRRNIARDLRNALNDLKRAKDYNLPPMAHNLLQIEGILGRLDPRMLPVANSDPATQMRQLTAENSTEWVEVCPEKYKGQDPDDFYYTTAFTSDCPNKVPTKEFLSIIIDGTDYKKSTLETLLASISERYKDVKLYVALTQRSNTEIIRRYSAVTAVRVTSSTPPAVRWMRLIRQVSTKYVLVGYNMAAFSPDTDLERLVRVLRLVPHVTYVSGATRNETGHWTVECYQARLELYGMALREGYTSSAEDCMYCDAVNGPFLTTTKSLISTPLDERLPLDVVFFDWFLRVRADDGLGMVCPDVLFFVSGDMKKSLQDHGSWRKLAHKLGVTDVYLPARNIHHFTCEEAGLSCDDRTNDLASPPCCVARLSRALREAIAAFDRAAVSVHIAQNTVVGGVKGGLQPWEPDVYLTTGSTYLEIEKVLTELRRFGFLIHLTAKDGIRAYRLRAHNHNIILSVRPINMGGSLPDGDKETPTRIHIGNGWVPAPPNPGLYARGLQGHGSLRHRPTNGTWPRCRDPDHHACLDHLPLDGSWSRLR